MRTCQRTFALAAFSLLCLPAAHGELADALRMVLAERADSNSPGEALALAESLEAAMRNDPKAGQFSHAAGLLSGLYIAAEQPQRALDYLFPLVDDPSYTPAQRVQIAGAALNAAQAANRPASEISYLYAALDEAAIQDYELSGVADLGSENLMGFNAHLQQAQYHLSEAESLSQDLRAIDGAAAPAEISRMLGNVQQAEYFAGRHLDRLATDPRAATHSVQLTERSGGASNALYLAIQAALLESAYWNYAKDTARSWEALERAIEYADPKALQYLPPDLVQQFMAAEVIGAMNEARYPPQKIVTYAREALAKTPPGLDAIVPLSSAALRLSSASQEADHASAIALADLIIAYLEQHPALNGKSVYTESWFVKLRSGVALGQLEEARQSYDVLKGFELGQGYVGIHFDDAERALERALRDAGNGHEELAGTTRLTASVDATRAKAEVIDSALSSKQAEEPSTTPQAATEPAAGGANGISALMAGIVVVLVGLGVFWRLVKR